MQNQRNQAIDPWRTFRAVFIGLIIAVQLMACAAAPVVAPKAQTDPAGTMESRWGIHLEGIRLTAIGHLVDFRYRVIDPEKAEPLMHRGEEAYLLDQATQMKLPVPMTRVGHLRGTGTKPVAGRVYAVMFSSGGVVKRGSQVTVVLGEFRAEDLKVQ